MQDFFAQYGGMLWQNTLITLYMVFGATALAYVAGIPMGIAVVLTRPDGLSPNAFIFKVLDFIVNVVRSIPFLILMILLHPIMLKVIGRTYGPSATVFALFVCAAPFIARMVESSLLEVDRGVIEAAQSMGASNWMIVRKVLLPEARVSLVVGATITLGTLLGYSAMAGAIGGGGLGDIAIRYGYYRYNTPVMLITVVLLVLLVQIMQAVGTKISRIIDRRITK